LFKINPKAVKKKKKKKKKMKMNQKKKKVNPRDQQMMKMTK
jgi:hypothetical protein